MIEMSSRKKKYIIFQWFYQKKLFLSKLLHILYSISKHVNNFETLCDKSVC